MANFCLFSEELLEKQANSLQAKMELYQLHYMGSSEFEWGAIPKAFRRLMYHFSEYEVFNTGIYTPENDELMVFCKKSCSTEVIQSIRQYIDKPYHLKEYSELEKVPKAKKEDTSYRWAPQ